MAVALFLFLLLANGCLASEGLSFSSRIIHRFSDEARVHLASRGYVDQLQSWPKKNTSEYFMMLLSRDLKQQRMKKLGSQDESLYPYMGSKTFFFGNALAWLHYTWIDIGTPTVSFLVALDSGSDMLWVPCDCLECAPLSARNYDVLDTDLNQYSPSLSNTSRHLPCSHKLCTSTCKGSKDPCPYKVEYASDNTSSAGFLIEDKLHLASNSRNATKNSVQASIILGCGSKQSGAFLEGGAPDGVLGLGNGNISVPSMLARAGLIQNSFSICFNENESGRILFGDQGNVSYQYTPFLSEFGKFVHYFVGVERVCVGSFCVKETGYKALIDTGTSFTYLPTKIYKTVVAEFDKHLNATRISIQQSPWEYCYNGSSQEFTDIPLLKFTFSKNQTFLIQNPLYTYPLNQEYEIICLTVIESEDNFVTIGQNFLTGYHMIFDRENLQFGWSTSDCQYGKRNFTSSNSGSPNSIPLPVFFESTATLYYLGLITYYILIYNL